MADMEDDQVSICSAGVFSDVASIQSLEASVPSQNAREDDEEERSILTWDISHIRNKQRRAKAYLRIKQEKKKEKIKLRKQRQKLREQLGSDAPPIQPAKTIENQREKEDTMVHPEDQEVLLDEETDEMANYFNEKRSPKVLITSSDRPKKKTTTFMRQFKDTLPNSEVYHRRGLALKKVIQQCIAKDFTDIIVINQDRSVPNAMLLCHLPEGPTVHFKLSNMRLRKDIPRCSTPTSHKPEIILNNFGTRLGHTVGRMFASLYPHEPQFRGRQVATYHNQRDFIFFRHHRYVFRNEKRVALKEIGPRFTLKLRSLQRGTFDSKYGEYEWLHKRHEMDTSRRKFHL